MDRDIKQYIMNVMKSGTSGCNHLEMTQALNCPTCQMKMIKAQSELKRLSKEYPEKFIRKEPEYKNSHEVERNIELLADRLGKDRLYQQHLTKLATGTPEEKRKEAIKGNKGYYERHYEEDGNIKMI